MKNISFGYLVLDENQIASPTWEFSLNGRAVPYPIGALDDWNYFADIRASCTFNVDLPRIRRQLAVPLDLKLGWVIVARSSGSPIIMASSPIEVSGGSQEISVYVPAANLGGTLSLEATMVVLDPGIGTLSPFAPSKVGHVVYVASTSLMLEGDGGQLPILPVSFKGQGLKNAESSMWWLKIMSHDLSAPANASLWLWLNTDNEQIRPLLEKPESELGSVWLQFLKTDFSRQLLREALASSDLDLSENYELGTLGDVLSAVVRLIASDIDGLRAKYMDDPGLVEAELQAVVGASR